MAVRDTKMYRDNGVIVIFVLFSMLFCDRTSSECTQLTPCSCIFPSGQGYDLTNLTHLGVITAPGSNYTFYFQPCKNTPLSVNTSECYKGQGVSLCALHDNEAYSLGLVEESKMIIHSENSKQPMLVYHHGNRITTISLSCCDFCQTHLLVDTVTNSTTYVRFRSLADLILHSPNACKVVMHVRGLSTGSILVILFFVFTGLYFIGGAIALKLLRGATGWEMMPNHSFWRDLPSLVRDGIVFTFNCCRADSYERI